MAKKIPEPMDKIKIAEHSVYADLIKAGLADNSGKILNKEAAVKFLHTKLVELRSEIDKTTKDGVVVDQYKYNTLNTEYDLIAEWINQLTHQENQQEPQKYPEPDDLAEYFAKKEHKKAKRKAFWGRIFGRSGK